MQSRRRLEEALKTDQELERALADLDAYFELAREGENVGGELRTEIDALSKQLERLETATLLAGENDRLNAIVTLHPGAGGTESQDWAEMLLRTYRRWAERHGFKFTLLEFQGGEEAGLKSATFLVTGEYAYGLLASETGVHRLVRISPFDAAARRHTSFASVFVSPEIDDNIEIDVSPTSCGSRPIAPRARAASTSTPRTPPSASPTCPPGPSSSARTNARSTATGRWR